MSSPQGWLTGRGDEPRTLVVVFLRGGADGLSLVAPIEDDAYYNARSRIAVPRKDAIRLDDFFGLNPLLKDLKPAYDEGRLAVIHGAGSEDSTRSHFEAQDLMEHAGIVAGGWLGRFLRYRPEPAGGALSAIALSATLPECLRGAPAAAVMRNVDEFTLGPGSAPLVRELEKFYGPLEGDLGDAGRDTLDALARIEKMRGTAYKPANGVKYPETEFALNLTQVARLIKAKVGLEAASVDSNGWDSHFVQGTIIDPRMQELAEGLAAFYVDMGSAMENVSVVVMTEFGRRVQENSTFGTDHGRASVMFAMGGGVKGGRVISEWQGLNSDDLEGPGDLPVTINYRNVLAPILRFHGAEEDFSRVFPNFDVKPIHLLG